MNDSVVQIENRRQNKRDILRICASLKETLDKHLGEIDKLNPGDPRDAILTLNSGVASAIITMIEVAEIIVDKVDADREAGEPSLALLKVRLLHLEQVAGRWGGGTSGLIDVRIVGDLCNSGRSCVDALILVASHAALPSGQISTFQESLGVIKSAFATQAIQLNSTALYQEATDRLASIAATETRVESIAQEVEQAAGRTANVKLSEHYGKLAGREAWAATSFRSAAILLVTGAFIAAVIVVKAALDNHETAVGTILVRLAVGVPVIFLAGHLAHESNGHRTVSRRAKEFQIRLDTVRPYAAELEEADRKALLNDVGRSILTGPLMLSNGTEGTFIDAQKIAEKAVEKTIESLNSDD